VPAQPDRSGEPAGPSPVLSLLEHSTEAFVALDRRWHCLYVNAQAERLLRRGRDQLVGRPLWDSFPGGEGTPFAAELRRAVADNVTVDFRAHWPAPDAWFDARACPSAEGLAVYLRDVTAQVATERALREGWDHVRLITDSVPALIGYVDRDGRYRFANAAYREWLGVAPEQVVGRTIADLLGPEAFEHRRPYVERALGGERVRFDGPTPHHTLGVRDCDVYYVPDAAGGEVRGFYVLVHDMTEHRRAERALRASESRLARAQRIAGLGDWELDWVTREVYWSPEMYRLCGVPPETHVPTVEAFMASVPEEDRTRMRLALERALSAGTSYHVDHRIVLPDGSVRLVSEQAEIVRDESGRPLRVVGTMLDVTGRAAAEAALRESRERLRAALAAAEMGTWRLDVRGGAATRDAEMSRLLGLPPEEASETADEFFSRVHPDDRAAVEAAARRAVADRGTYFAEFRVVRPDGTVRWLREQGKVLCEPGPSGRPEPVSITGASVDVSDRKRAEQAVRDANQRMATVMNASPLAVMAVDLQGNVLIWNPTAERMLGWSADEAVGRFLPLVPPEDAEQALAVLRRTVEGHPVAGLESRRRRKDGSTFDAALWTSRLDGEDGRPFAVLGILADVTERRQAEAALEQARREAEAARAAAEAASSAKDQFLAVLSHELRTPLTPVVMTLAGLELDRSLSQDVRDDLAMIRRNVELETRLIDDLLDVTRITHGKLRLHPQPTNVHALVESALDILRSEFRGKRIELACDLRAADSVVSGDAARLQQVVWNLVRNAIKFAPERGHVSVRTANPTPRTLALEVGDDGIGIEPAALPRLFNAFEQAEQTVTRQFGGLGLGLAISRALVELHGGTIRAHSAGRGRGATFTVELPTVGAIERLVSRLPPVAGAAGPARDSPPPVRVLLVEDHPDTLRTLKRLLEKMGYHVIPASSAAAALSALSSESVDVLVSDIGLPDATGHELMRQVRRDHDLPGIAVSGYGMDSDLKNSHDAGFFMHITKPVDVKQLDAAIRTAVRASTAH
jgi:PAS domain S-box-containing protein